MLLTDKGKPDTTARHVLQVLAEHAHSNGGGARPAVMRIQYRTGYDRRTVQRALRRLEDGNLIASEGTVNGCTVWRLAVKLKRPASDWADLEAEEVRQREADAERQRRSRAKRVTHSNDVTVTDAESVTEDGRHALSVPTSRTQNPDVTDGTPPEPSLEPSGEPSLSQHLPQQTTMRPPAPVDEREISPPEQDASLVLAAYAQALGRPVSASIQLKIRDQTGKLLADGFPVWWIADRARELPAYGTDLAKHCEMSTIPVQAQRPGAAVKACKDHDPFDRMIRDPNTGDHTECPLCHPTALARARRQGAA